MWFLFYGKKSIVDWKKLLISSIMNLVSLLFKLMDLNVQLIDLPKHMNNMDFPQRCQPYVYQGLSTLGIFSSSRKFQKTRNSSPNDGKNQIPIKKDLSNTKPGYPPLVTTAWISQKHNLQKGKIENKICGKMKKRNTLHQQDIPKNKRLTPHQLIPNPLGFYEYTWLKVEVWLQWLLKYIFME